mmetsp:Transcript_6440/g.15167  ORF Transcript_6440/g.15167 Transcript_6440/m.15167 type:complete len:241 (-) Transcript_6440:505-1227(-)
MAYSVRLLQALPRLPRVLVLVLVLLLLPILARSFGRLCSFRFRRAAAVGACETPSSVSFAPSKRRRDHGPRFVIKNLAHGIAAHQFLPRLRWVVCRARQERHVGWLPPLADASEERDRKREFSHVRRVGALELRTGGPRRARTVGCRVELAPLQKARLALAHRAVHLEKLLPSPACSVQKRWVLRELGHRRWHDRLAREWRRARGVADHEDLRGRRADRGAARLDRARLQVPDGLQPFAS